MKFRITFKSPDSVDAAIKDLDPHEQYIDSQEILDLNPEIDEVIKKFVAYKECISIEFDTENLSARVIEQ